MGTLYSPDGRWWWNGQQWLPVPQQPYLQRRTNHVLHIILSVLTLGLWLPIYAAVALWNGYRTSQSYLEVQRSAPPPPPV